LVKIDVQGWEPAVLEGMRGKLERNPRARILFEFCSKDLKDAGFEPTNFLEDLLDRGYTLREEASARKIFRSDVRTFSERLPNSRYTDIEAYMEETC
jgi:hypothetical protein